MLLCCGWRSCCRVSVFEDVGRLGMVSTVKRIIKCDNRMLLRGLAAIRLTMLALNSLRTGTGCVRLD